VCGTFSLALKEEHTLTVFENKVPEKLFILLEAMFQSGHRHGRAVLLTSLAPDFFLFLCIKEILDETEL
jgi:hypothetical protein